MLYPGTESLNVVGFHEVIPGLGAFSIRPGHWTADSVYLKQFLSDVKSHMLDRVSQREKMSYYQYETYKKENDTVLREYLPEPIGDNRDFMPDKVWVIVAYYKSEAHLQWILDKHIYNLRAGIEAGSASLDMKLISARYLLLYHGRETHFLKLYKRGPKVYTRAQLLAMGYPQYQKTVVDETGKRIQIVDIEKEKQESGRIYLGFSLYKYSDVEKELKGYQWNLQGVDLSSQKGHYNLIRLSDLVQRRYRER